MQNFYFRSQLMVFIMIVLISLTGCSFYPAITPVEKNQQVNLDTNTVANNDVEGNPVVQIEMNDLNSSSQSEEDGVNLSDSTTAKPGNTTETTNDVDETDSLNIDFEEQPIVDLTNGHHDDNQTNSSDEQQTIPMEIEGKKIALTFDDGPDAKYTPQVLDILKEKGIKATFFIVGIQIKKYPEVVQRMVDEGHLIANHTYNHPNLKKLSKTEVLSELDSTDELIESIVGFRPKIVRPPYGSIDDNTRTIIQDTGRHVVLWNIDPRDWASTPVDEMYANVMKNAKDEGNILFHSFGGKQIQNTVDLLPRVIDSLLAEGYTFVTADYYIQDEQ